MRESVTHRNVHNKTLHRLSIYIYIDNIYIYIIFFHTALADTVIYIYHEWATTIGKLEIFSCPESNPRPSCQQTLR